MAVIWINLDMNKSNPIFFTMQTVVKGTPSGIQHVVKDMNNAKQQLML